MLINSNLSHLLFGRLFVNMGDSLYYITIMWLIYDLTENTMFTAIAGALFMLPEVFAFFMALLLIIVIRREHSSYSLYYKLL